jgi:hypothetical protein
MIYVLGVDHKREQWPHDINVKEKVVRLKETIRKICKEKDIQLIAEELSADARNYQGIATTYAEEIATELGIKRIDCDPGQSERDRIGVKSRYQISQELGIQFPMEENAELEKKINDTPEAKKSDTKREEYWLEQIKTNDGISGNTLLVCGYEHPVSFIA